MVAHRFTPADLEKMLHDKGVDTQAPEPEPDTQQDHDPAELMYVLSWVAYGVQNGLLIDMLQQAYDAGRREGK